MACRLLRAASLSEAYTKSKYSTDRSGSNPRLAVIAAAAAAIVAINRDFYALLSRRGGVAFALACIPLHIVYFVCAGLGFAMALLERRVLR